MPSTGTDDDIIAFQQGRDLGHPLKSRSDRSGSEDDARKAAAERARTGMDKRARRRLLASGTSLGSQQS